MKMWNSGWKASYRDIYCRKIYNLRPRHWPLPWLQVKLSCLNFLILWNFFGSKMWEIFWFQKSVKLSGFENTREKWNTAKKALTSHNRQPTWLKFSVCISERRNAYILFSWKIVFYQRIMMGTEFNEFAINVSSRDHSICETFSFQFSDFENLWNFINVSSRDHTMIDNDIDIVPGITLWAATASSVCQDSQGNFNIRKSHENMSFQ